MSETSKTPFTDKMEWASQGAVGWKVVDSNQVRRLEELKNELGRALENIADSLDDGKDDEATLIAENALDKCKEFNQS